MTAPDPEYLDGLADEAFQVVSDINGGDLAAAHRRLWHLARHDPLRLVQVCVTIGAMVDIDKPASELCAWLRLPASREAA